MTSHLYHADIVSWLLGRQWLVENGFMPKYHAVFADPPYFLGSISKRFGKANAAPAKFGRDGAFQRQSRGFMGQSWDGFESLYHYEDWVTSWAEPLLSFMHPGALLVMSGGTRTYHRLASGIENAGWEILDCVICWVYGSGFPKSLDIGRVTQAEQWEGYGTALKPSYEPYIIARAPRAGYTYADLALQFGTGALNIDGCRIPATDKNAFPAGIISLTESILGGGKGLYDSRPRPADQNPDGRFPANTLFVCECQGDHDPACSLRILDEQSGQLTSGTGAITKASAYGTESRAVGTPHVEYGDTGGASRFFYQAKAARWEREAGLSDFAQQIVNDGRDTPIDNPFQRGETKRRNIHPTVKPIQLCEYITRLLLPPAGDTPRRLLVPFAGVGSEMIGAQLAGWDEIDGVELTADYIPINAARRRWWAQYSTYDQAQRAAQVTAAAAAVKAVEQVSIFDYLDQQNRGQDE